MLVPKEILDNLGKSGGKMAWFGSPFIALMFYVLIDWNRDLTAENIKYHNKVIQLDTICKMMEVKVTNCERYTREAVDRFIDCTEEKEDLMEQNQEFKTRLKIRGLN
jgi:hypothetical protein